MGIRVLAMADQICLRVLSGMGTGLWWVGVWVCWWGWVQLGGQASHQHSWQPSWSRHGWWLSLSSLRVCLGVLVGWMAAIWRRCQMTAPVPALVGMRCRSCSLSVLAVHPLPSASYSVSVRSGLLVGRWWSCNPSNTTAGLSISLPGFARSFVR